MKSRYPIGFQNWPRPAQVDWCTASFTRAGLIRMLFSMAGVRLDRRIHRDTKVRKDEFAHIYLELDNTGHDH